MISYAQFFVIYSLSIVVAVYLSLRVMVGGLLKLRRPALEFLKNNYLFLLVLAALPLMVQMLSLLKTHLSDGHAISQSISNGQMLFSLGGGLITDLQNSIDSGIAATYLKFAYMWVFAFFTYFLPVLFVAKQDRSTLVAFTIAMTVNYMVLILFYIAFPTAVSSKLPHEGVEPVLYSSAYWGSMAVSVDSLTNCFPSGHVSLSFTALFIVMFAGLGYRRLAYVLGATAASIVIAVLYLGIHYPLDVVGGLALAAGSTAVARSDSIKASLSRAIRSARTRRLEDA